MMQLSRDKKSFKRSSDNNKTTYHHQESKNLIRDRWGSTVRPFLIALQYKFTPKQELPDLLPFVQWFVYIKPDCVHFVCMNVWSGGRWEPRVGERTAGGGDKRG